MSNKHFEEGILITLAGSLKYSPPQLLPDIIWTTSFELMEV